MVSAYVFLQATGSSIGFYQAIFNGEDIPEAHQLGCAQIRMICESEHATPELLSRDNTAT